METERGEAATPTKDPPNKRLSYKFQRLRERIRAAIDGGELAGKLPGERALARQFNVNAKTLSKALTDLAAEGVLQRNIGLGTFVRDGAAVPPTVHVLVLAAESVGGSLAAELSARALAATATAADADLPPSLLAHYDVVVIDSTDVTEETIRGLLVRGKDVITVGRVSRPYSTHALLPHAGRTAVEAARKLAAVGHRRFLVVHEDAEIVRAVADAVPDAQVRPGRASDAPAAADDGCTAALCGTGDADATIGYCRAAGIDVPRAFSVAAFGRAHGPPRWDGCFVTDAAVADAVTDVLAAGLPHKPLTLWLAGVASEAKTAAPPPFVAAKAG